MTLPIEESKLLQQISAEYNMAFQYMNPKRVMNLDRYRILSNQSKTKDLVSDKLLFTVFQTSLSKLYDDKLSVVFSPGHPDDTDKVDGLNPVAKYDYYKMGKDQLDYDWDWYSCFWGSGFLDVSEWDGKKKLMRPSVVNNATLLIDPDGSLVNGDQRGFGAYRFWGREIAKTKDQMSKDGYQNFSELTPINDFTSLNYYAKQAVRLAQNLAQPAPVNDFENDYISHLEWWTTIKGEKWIVTVDLKFTKVLKAKKWWDSTWPLIQRKLFPIPNDPLGISIPDLVEDLNRHRSVLMNLGLLMAKSDLYPMYIYDRNVISPTSDLSFGFNKWIPADGNPREGVTPLQKPAAGQIVSYIFDMLDQAAQRSTGATSMQQGVQSEKPRSANEVVRVFNAAEERISTSAKVFGWSEREFWNSWLKNSSHYMTSLHEKWVRIDGPFGPKFKSYSGDDFGFEEDPDIVIESKTLNDAKSQDAKSDAVAFTNLIAQDQSVNRRYWNKRTAKLFGVETEEINRLFPQTPDELIAEDENVRLSENKLVKISIDDDHQTHLLIHANADDTPASIVHIEAHKAALKIKRQQMGMNPETLQNPGNLPMSTQTTPNMVGQGSAPAVKTAPSFQVQQ